MDSSLLSQINILQETKATKALPFLNNFLTIATTKHQTIHFVCFQEPPEYYKWILPPGSKCIFYDVFTDPLGWNAPFHSPHQICSIEDNFLQLINGNANSDEGENEKSVIVFDGLSSVTRQNGIHYVCKLIHSFTMPFGNVNVSQFIGIAESDILSELELNALKYVAHSYIQICSDDVGMKSNSKVAELPLRYVVDILVKKKTGKVFREAGIYYFTSNCKLMKSKDVVHSNIEDDDASDQSDPMAHVPFKLKLTNNEKVARSQVRLPYMLDEECKATQLDKTSGGGRILYERDDADDFDEEDPDDDLDI